MSAVESHDELLARLLDELVTQSRHGRDPDFSAVLAPLSDSLRPELEQELRELWATAMVAEDLAAVGETLEWIDGDADHSDQSPPRSSAAPTAALPRVIGDYELLEVIGRGGMGIVYKARQISLKRAVALKMILRGDFATIEDLHRFRSEAEAAARISHPLIVPVYEVGEFANQTGQFAVGQPFFSMQFIAGTTLGERLANGPMPPREAATLLARVCRAIDSAHEQGVLHRDLKPSNILIDETERPYVTDFGLAKQVTVTRPADQIEGDQPSGITVSGAILGTPGYMAPEQAIGSRGVVGPRTDVYALGAILYAMQTGRPPFQAASAVDTVLMVLEQDPPPIAVLNPKADRDLAMITLKAMQKPVDLRYDSAAAFADDLDAFLSHEPITARSSHLGQVLSRAFRPTHHADVLENWGILWMWHALVLLVLCVVTEFFEWSGVSGRTPYVALWTVGLGAWALFFWDMRRAAGPVTFVERQIAHVWAGSMACVTMLFAIEAILGLDVLKLSPVLGLVAGTVFLIKAGILSGEFYVQAVALYATSLAMAVFPEWGLILFGVASALCFFVPGLKFYRQRKSAA